VQALLRRGRRPRSLAVDESQTRVGPVRVDFRNSLVEMDGRPVPLTWREFEVLRLLAQERGRVVRRATLLGLLLGAPTPRALASSTPTSSPSGGSSAAREI
jgi:DNA-binding response OmpR family regulator